MIKATRLSDGIANQQALKDATGVEAGASKVCAIISGVEKVWRAVFGELEMNPNTPFYSIRSSPIAAAQLAEQYRRLGYRMEMEGIIEHTTMKQQSDVLSRDEAPS